MLQGIGDLYSLKSFYEELFSQWAIICVYIFHYTIGYINNMSLSEYVLFNLL